MERRKEEEKEKEDGEAENETAEKMEGGPLDTENGVEGGGREG